jgi:30S ribosomal protein S31
LQPALPCFIRYILLILPPVQNILFTNHSLILMGRGDVKTKRGKIWRGSKGKSRPKLKKLKTLQKQQAAAQA